MTSSITDPAASETLVHAACTAWRSAPTAPVFDRSARWTQAAWRSVLFDAVVIAMAGWLIGVGLVGANLLLPRVGGPPLPWSHPIGAIALTAMWAGGLVCLIGIIPAVRRAVEDLAIARVARLVAALRGSPAAPVAVVSVDRRTAAVVVDGVRFIVPVDACRGVAP